MAKKARKKDKPKAKPKKPTVLDMTMLAVEFLKERVAALEARVAALEKANTAPDDWNKKYWPTWPTWPTLPTDWPSQPVMLPKWETTETTSGVGKTAPVNITETPSGYGTVTVTDTFQWHKPEDVIGPGRNTLK